MAGQNDDSRRNFPLSQRDLCRSRSAEGRGNSRNHLNFNSSLPQGFNLFARAAENERIPALQANDLETQESKLNQERIDFFLARAFLAAAFSDAP